MPFSGLFTFINPNPLGTQTDTDNFNRANQTPISGNWTPATSSFDLSSNTAVPDSLGADSVAFWNIWSHGNDQYSQADATSTGATGGGVGIGVCVRKSTVAGTLTFYRLVLDSAGNIQLGSLIAGSFTTLANRTVTYIAGKKIGLSVQGTTLKIWYGGVQQGASVTDSNIASGSPGIAYSGATSATFVDNWDAGTVP